ncbi:hypothetical protein [Azospirillum argentinense]|uniref:hypothetical protein n=1 Tax=Azospirillum argentinense TaxID=2970906 RepID=UPI0032DE6509
MPLYARTPCQIIPAGLFDEYGTPALGAAQDALCAVVKFDLAAAKTSVRTDSSASRGTAEEIVPAIRLLFPTLYPIRIGDRVRLFGALVEASSVQPRLAVSGEHDHNQVDCIATESAGETG